VTQCKIKNCQQEVKVIPTNIFLFLDSILEGTGRPCSGNILPGDNKYKTYTWIDLKKIVDLPYGTANWPLKFWVTYGGDGEKLKGCVDDTKKDDISSSSFKAGTGVLRIAGFPVPSNPSSNSWSTDLNINVYSQCGCDSKVHWWRYEETITAGEAYHLGSTSKEPQFATNIIGGKKISLKYKGTKFCNFGAKYGCGFGELKFD